MRNKQLLFTLLIGFFLGSLWLIAVRFANYDSDTVHYHANFALYINGAQEKFNSFTFYEEVQACGGDEVNNPRTRVHMHDNVSHVAHVHDSAATWGHFFANLGYTLGNDLIRTDAGVFQDGQKGNELTFTINGQEAGDVANRTIRSEDVLLINYGKESGDVLKQRYDAITHDAAEYNKRNDPSACKGGKPVTFSERFKHAVGF